MINRYAKPVLLAQFACTFLLPGCVTARTKSFAELSCESFANSDFGARVLRNEERPEDAACKRYLKDGTPIPETGSATTAKPDANAGMPGDIGTKAKEEAEKDQPLVSQERAAREKTTEELVVNGTLRTLPIIKILGMAGYNRSSPIQIYSSTLRLDNLLGYPALDARYFIFASRGKKPRIDKVLVILRNLGGEASRATNLLEYAPMLVYVKGRKHEVFDDGSSASGPEEFAHYISKELAAGEVQAEYIVYPNKAGYFVFNYGDEYRANRGMFSGPLTYDDVCALGLKGAAGLRGESLARFAIGEGGKFHLSDIKAVYP